MKPLLKNVREEKIVVTNTIQVNPEALKEIAVELLKGNYTTESWAEETQIDFPIIQKETVIELVVANGYKVTIENIRLS